MELTNVIRLKNNSVVSLELSPSSIALLMMAAKILFHTVKCSFVLHRSFWQVPFDLNQVLHELF